MNDSFEALFAEAEQNLKEEETEIPDEWGPLRQTEEGGRLLTRYLGRGPTPRYKNPVFRFVAYPGEPTPFYLTHKWGLEQVLTRRTSETSSASCAAATRTSARRT